MSPRSGVGAVREGSRVVLRPHHGPQPQLHAGLPVSTRDRPTGRLDDAPTATHAQMHADKAAMWLMVSHFRTACACGSPTAAVTPTESGTNRETPCSPTAGTGEGKPSDSR